MKKDEEAILMITKRLSISIPAALDLAARDHCQARKTTMAELTRLALCHELGVNAREAKYRAHRGRPRKLEQTAASSFVRSALLGLCQEPWERAIKRLMRATKISSEELRRARDKVGVLRWADVQSNIHDALSEIGSRENTSHHLDRMVGAYRKKLQVLDHQRSGKEALEWGRTQHNIALAFLRLGDQRSSGRSFQQAADAFSEALTELTRELVPVEWAEANAGLGIALLRMGEGKKDGKLLMQAIAAFERALNELDQEDHLLKWVETQNNLATALVRLGECENRTEKFKRAKKICDQLLATLPPHKTSWLRQMAQDNLNLARQGMHETGPIEANKQQPSDNHSALLDDYISKTISQSDIDTDKLNLILCLYSTYYTGLLQIMNVNNKNDEDIRDSILCDILMEITREILKENTIPYERRFQILHKKLPRLVQRRLRHTYDVKSQQEMKHVHQHEDGYAATLTKRKEILKVIHRRLMDHSLNIDDICATLGVSPSKLRYYLRDFRRLDDDAPSFGILKIAPVNDSTQTLR